MEVTKEGDDTTHCSHCAYHCPFLDISLFMQLGTKHQIFFIANMITNNAFHFEMLKKRIKIFKISHFVINWILAVVEKSGF